MLKIILKLYIHSILTFINFFHDMKVASIILIFFKLQVIIFGLVWFLLKKSNQTKIKKKNRNRFKPTGFSSVFRTKTEPVWLGFFGLA